MNFDYTHAIVYNGLHWFIYTIGKLDRVAIQYDDDAAYVVFQKLLKAMVEDLVKLGVPDALKAMVFKMWTQCLAVWHQYDSEEQDPSVLQGSFPHVKDVPGLCYLALR